jgi:hypothetical protein
VVEQLLSKHEAPSSTTSTRGREEGKKGRRDGKRGGKKRISKAVGVACFIRKKSG